jgi:hypothetical protein
MSSAIAGMSAVEAIRGAAGVAAGVALVFAVLWVASSPWRGWREKVAEAALWLVACIPWAQEGLNFLLALGGLGRVPGDAALLALLCPGPVALALLADSRPIELPRLSRRGASLALYLGALALSGAFAASVLLSPPGAAWGLGELLTRFRVRWELPALLMFVLIAFLGIFAPGARGDGGGPELGRTFATPGGVLPVPAAAAPAAAVSYLSLVACLDSAPSDLFGYLLLPLLGAIFAALFYISEGRGEAA